LSLERESLAVPSLARIYREQVGHDLVNDILMVQHGLLHPHNLLQHELMIHGELCIAIREMLDLLLLGDNLLVEQVDLLRGSGLVVALGLFAGGRGLPANIV
jgi:hypothetical protein